MFDWFFEMPEWLYLLLGMIAVIAFAAYMARKEIKVWFATASDPSYWETMRAESELMILPMVKRPESDKSE